MKNLRLLLIAIIILCLSCENDPINDAESIQDKTSLHEIEIPKEIVQKISALNFNTEGIEEIEYQFSDTLIKKGYLVEGDIMLFPDQIDQMTGSGIDTKQYRTNNLVNTHDRIRNIEIFRYSSGSNALTTKMVSALNQAINNYNNLNLNITFSVVVGSSPSSNQIVIKKANGAAGGVAGFPSNGNPFYSITIYSETDNKSLAVNEHVITHEIGHCIGLRHTDWQNRYSCNNGYKPESSSPNGAVHIPGTPTGTDNGSLMLACFSDYESGNFGNYDITALSYLYAGILGPDLVCTDNITYNLGGDRVASSWNVSSKLSIVSQTSTSITVKQANSNSYGAGTITANVQNSQELTKELHVGKPTANLPSVSVVCKGQFNEYFLPESHGATTYRLVSSSPNLRINGSTSPLVMLSYGTISFVGMSSGTYLLELFVENECGTSRAATYVIVENCGGGPGGFGL